MLRSTLMSISAIVLGCGASLARADHDGELNYVLRGALIGATLGEVAYQSSHSSYSRHGYDRRDHRWRGRGHGARFDPWRRGYGFYGDYYPSRRYFGGRLHYYDRSYRHFHRHRRGYCPY
jgi:hypothetical protein